MTKPQKNRRIKFIKSLRGSLKGSGALKTLIKNRKLERAI
jgi:hypothetical protein